ncbi:hypothetical protein [Mycobacterium intracellulare]|uniref:hypothetical protein n=1 Tax=Mycobacterium intracellulare TaxID=1767 RepID=UPI001926830E|nr:hypothetical protein [Mycobacterium intracellulare]BCP29578.1 hypothetical protein MINTM026_05480 [Mycobacterium intracellulare]
MATNECSRHPATQHLLDLFAYDHLPPGDVQITSGMCSLFAHEMAARLGDGPELTTGLRKLLEAKDCFVRQAVIDVRSGK